MNAKILKPEIKNLYLEGKDVPEICKRFKGLSESTLYNWIKKENWKTLRDEKMKKFIKSPEILMTMLENMITSLGEKIEDPEKVAKIADSISKISKSIKNLFKDKDRLASVLFVIGELGKYMNEQDNGYIYDEDFRGKFDKLLSGFQNLMITKFSPNNF